MYALFTHRSYAKELVLVIEPSARALAAEPGMFEVQDDGRQEERRQLHNSMQRPFDVDTDETGRKQFGRASQPAARSATAQRAETPLFRGMTPADAD